MKKLTLLLFPAFLLFCSLGPTAQLENFNYDVLIDGRPVGTYTASRTEANGVSIFRVETNTAAGLIRRSEIKSVMLSSYKDSKMMSTDIKTWVDNKLESSSVLFWDGNQYVKRDGDELSEICSDMVSYSSACVYFEEPFGRTALFYENYGRNLQVVNLGNHQYKVGLPNGSVEFYTYEKGKVVTVEIVQSFATTTLNVTS